ncbi:leucyl/phenylalanyl-tRNA--protein transferase [Thiohalomonas denitrificans]|uniref:leucyl/phenylalanyl-tRNA--protein transferase n=1 Tax=Thiohalomonas denitrificans TaxID=415747 RepID=UPI00294FFE86|nr:leucyl/phenylalanyl-tRNA--protein transferase [Thiohalomonas denitrificans]
MRETGAPFLLEPGRPGFPDPELALEDPDGLLAIGGDLSPRRLLSGYRMGIFPWYSEEQPILWWTPDPRAVLFPADLKVSRSLRKALRKHPFEVTLDRAFDAVIEGCAAPRGDGLGTWITPEMNAAYHRLHEMGFAHSVESWEADELIGGLYGIAIGRVFFGESMFTRRTNASKIAFVHLVRQLQAWGFELIDCQVASEHLASFGAMDIPRREFMSLLDDHCERPGVPSPWHFDTDPTEFLW